MKNKNINLVIVLALTSLISCVQRSNASEVIVGEETKETSALCSSDGSESCCSSDEVLEVEPHKYGGWYCPDNLNGFPAVDIADWSKVPVVNGRLATKEETQTEAALILVDTEKYPNAKPLDIKMPKLATIYNRSAGREDIIIVIQALNIDNDSIVGFRYLNGGNGSARLNEVKILTEKETDKITTSKFVSMDIDISANQLQIYEVITRTENESALHPTFDKGNKLDKTWRTKSNVNYKYTNSGKLTSEYAGKLYGCYYVQNDYEKLSYTEKFLLLEDEKTGITTLKITCGPYVDDFETQKSVLTQWSKKVKELSEKK